MPLCLFRLAWTIELLVQGLADYIILLLKSTLYVISTDHTTWLLNGLTIIELIESLKKGDSAVQACETGHGGQNAHARGGCR